MCFWAASQMLSDIKKERALRGLKLLFADLFQTLIVDL